MSSATSTLAGGATLAARWLHEPQPISNQPVVVGISIPCGAVSVTAANVGDKKYGGPQPDGYDSPGAESDRQLCGCGKDVSSKKRFHPPDRNAGPRG